MLPCLPVWVGQHLTLRYAWVVTLGGNQVQGQPHRPLLRLRIGNAWDKIIADTMVREAHFSIQSPLDGWQESEQRWAITTGRQYHADGAFAVDLGLWNPVSLELGRISSPWL